MNSKKAVKALFVSVIASVFAPGLAAKGFNYTYTDLGYQYVNADRFDMDAARVDASFGLMDIMAFRLGYTRGWTDDFPTSEDPSGDPDLNEFRFGLRPHFTMTKGLALECARHNIRVNAVNPVAAETGFMKGATGQDELSEELKANLISTIPLARLTEPADIAAAVTFLASEDAAFITGTAMNVDGGRTV